MFPLGKQFNDEGKCAAANGGVFDVLEEQLRDFLIEFDEGTANQDVQEFMI